MTGIAAASFFSNTCRFGGCGLHFENLNELIVHIEDNHIDTDPRVLEKQELQQPTYVALSYINRFMTEAARREQETLKKKIQPKLSLPLTGGVSRNSVSTPPRHSSGSLTPPVTPPITPSSSFRSSTPTGSEYDEEEVDYEESDSDESWTTESAISSESILSSMCMNGGDEKPFACPVPGCKKRYKVRPVRGGGASGRVGPGQKTVKLSCRENRRSYSIRYGELGCDVCHHWCKLLPGGPDYHQKSEEALNELGFEQNIVVFEAFRGHVCHSFKVINLKFNFDTHKKLSTACQENSTGK
uniref:JAZF zinc finger 1 n=1 Tax=Paramormyrops kingsleyae TaxID=1676925 RepID=A0A3B3S812_9TELE